MTSSTDPSGPRRRDADTGEVTEHPAEPATSPVPDPGDHGEGGEAATARTSTGVQRRRRQVWSAAGHTVSACLRYRVTGLAAEAAFFAVLSLPPLIFGLAGAIGFVAQSLDVATVRTFRDQILALAGRVLAPEIVDSVLAPTLDDVLSAGRFEVISLGFVIALWSGSRALNVFIDTITIMYGLGGRRGIVQTRALSFVLYLMFLVIGVILLPLALAGPDLVDALLPTALAWLGALYWPLVLLLSACFVATLYHLSTPVKSRWWAALPGAGLTLIVWLGGSFLLRFALSKAVGTTSIYGPLAAPIALLIWFYVTSLAVLIGAAFNAAADRVWPDGLGIGRYRRQQPPPDPLTTAERPPGRPWWKRGA